MPLDPDVDGATDGDRGGAVDRVAPDRRLLLDVMLGRLARYLRMCGYDAAYALDRDVEADDALLALSSAEDRLLVTRDRQLARRAPNAVRLDAHDVLDQLRELRAAGLSVSLSTEPRRCGRCNGRLRPVVVGEPVPTYAPTPDTTECYRCRDCGQVFWKGSHWDDVRERLERL